MDRLRRQQIACQSYTERLVKNHLACVKAESHQEALNTLMYDIMDEHRDEAAYSAIFRSIGEFAVHELARGSGGRGGQHERRPFHNLRYADATPRDVGNEKGPAGT
jgi:hypothetical protein